MAFSNESTSGKPDAALIHEARRNATFEMTAFVDRPLARIGVLFSKKPRSSCAICSLDGESTCSTSLPRSATQTSSTRQPASLLLLARRTISTQPKWQSKPAPGKQEMPPRVQGRDLPQYQVQGTRSRYRAHQQSADYALDNGNPASGGEVC
jgi:hypothetical protein